MLTHIIYKELRLILFSPKFPVTFGMVSALILLSVLIGLREFHQAEQEYNTSVQLAAQELRERSSWAGLETRVFRRPEPMQIFVSGVQNDIGRWSAVSPFESVALKHSLYEDAPLFAVFRFLDFPFIAQIVFSLLAILYTYDAISGERESGTLALTLTGPVSRATLILGKTIGVWIGWLIPLLVPLAIGCLLVLIDQPGLSSGDWMSVGLILAVSLLYGTVFIVAGILISTLFRNSAASFMAGLGLWMLSALVIPRVAMILAGYIVPTPSVEYTEAQQAQYARDRWTRFNESLGQRWETRMAQIRTRPQEEREAFRQANMSKWMEEEDAARRQVEQEIDEYAARRNMELRNLKIEQESTGFALAGVSPAAAYQHAAMALAGVDISLKHRYEDAMRDFKTRFSRVADQKRKEGGQRGGIMIEVDSEQGFRFSVPRERGTIDASALPAFNPPRQAPPFPVVDIGLMAGLCLIGFGCAVWRFQTYDIR
jgi:ABC-type transport system involved in multi-copper enzyme maturation permease subunit